jgi:hypothetical protein
LEISGSDSVVELVKQELGLSGHVEEKMPQTSARPTVFLSYASEDKLIAKLVADRLMQNGIETFFAEWEIRAGDSIRQKIDQGLEECTHFIVLATETSIEKEWVKTEIDGVYRRKIEGQCTLIPVRHKLDARRLPPSLGGLHAPALDDVDSDIKALIDDIFDVSKKPALGPIPSIIAQKVSSGALGLSPAAEALVRLCMEKTEHGDDLDPQLDNETISIETGLNKDDIIDAIEELEDRGFVKHSRHIGDQGIGRVLSQAVLYVQFDKHFKEWDPEQDALKVAVALMNEAVDGNIEGMPNTLDGRPAEPILQLHIWLSGDWSR